ncbi:hypothetical protein SAMN05444166_4809 [Singulisphaera sp. GP187]|uniref:hypothetical protein n=1 Tax=Singulisphaera sp. GP187 TaxID=1882752 RepID=UPI00092B19A1|nr:hypothetical protein [Singulisphaera sp. GP187]SIO44806.1 hypothetical protein SAMN05444166_4809 [Singulisphaera sp. GP187]
MESSSDVVVDLERVLDQHTTLIIARLEPASRAGYAADAVKLLDETGTGERWRPLREALNAVAENAPESLRRLAPEVREPALEIFRQITRSRPDSSEASR